MRLAAPLIFIAALGLSSAAGQPAARLLEDELKSEDPVVAMKAIEELKQRADTASSLPLMILGSRLFDFGERREGLFWFYAGQLRARYELPSGSANSGLLTMYIGMLGPRVNAYALANPGEFDAAIERAATWERQTVCKWIEANAKGIFPTGIAKDRLEALVGLDAFRKHVRDVYGGARSQAAASLVSEPDCVKPKPPRPWKMYCSIYRGVRLEKHVLCANAHDEAEARQRIEGITKKDRRDEISFLSSDPGVFAMVRVRLCGPNSSSCETINETIAMSMGHVDTKGAITAALDECTRQLGLPCRAGSEAADMTVMVLVGKVSGFHTRAYGLWDITRPCTLEIFRSKRLLSCPKHFEGVVTQQIRAELDPDNLIDSPGRSAP